MVVKVLLVDDDRDFVDLIAFALTRAGLDVIAAHETPAALKLLEAERPDVAVLDVEMGRWNGFDLLRDLRKQSDIPVIMLSGQAAEKDKLRGFELGADDYVTKPFSHHELLARSLALMKRQGQPARAAAPPPVCLQVGPLTLNATEHTATKDGQPLGLTVTEFKLLHYLMARPGAVAGTRELMKQVWGFDDPSGNDAVRIALHRLRRKIEGHSGEPQLVHTVPGVGVMLKPPRPDDARPRPVGAADAGSAGGAGAFPAADAATEERGERRTSA